MKMTSVSEVPTFDPIDLVDVVTGDEGDDGGVIAMRERHAGVGGDAERRGDAGHDFERDARIGEGFGFFAAASEDERVAAFQADDVQAAAAAIDEQRADLVLREGVVGFLLADVDALGSGRGEGEKFGGSEMVVEDAVGLIRAGVSL